MCLILVQCQLKERDLNPRISFDVLCEDGIDVCYLRIRLSADVVYHQCSFLCFTVVSVVEWVRDWLTRGVVFGKVSSLM